MRRIVLAAFSLSLLGVSSAAPASAHVFLWTGLLPGLVLVLSDNAQIFSFEPGGVQFECNTLRMHGVASNGTAMTVKALKLIGTYTGCTAAGFSMTVTPVEYLLSAEEALAVEKPFVLTIAVLGCSIKYTGGPPNSTLKTVKYLNRPQDLLAHLAITELTSLASGGQCGTAGQEKTAGELKGLLLVSLDGGTLKWG